MYVPTLKKEQIASELAACYGVSMSNTGLSFEDIERMRRLIIEHDATSTHVETTDLNNPPRKPYQFQKFPMLMYYGAKTATILNETDLEEATAAGWTHDASGYVDRGANALSVPLQREAEEVQEQIEQRRVRRTRNHVDSPAA
jgi:hypothetical protein